LGDVFPGESEDDRMRINLLYFTSTGNTLWLVRRARALFEASRHAVELYEAVKDGRAALEDCDLIGVFYPVWGSDMPDPLRELFAGLADGAGGGRRLFLIGDCGVFTGDTGMHWKRLIEPKGFDVFYVDHVLMPININVPWFNFWQVPRGWKKKAILGRAEVRLRCICEAVLEGERHDDGTGLFDRLGGWGQRAFYADALAFWKGMFAVDASRCTLCGLCRRMCPVENISIEGDRVRFGERCIVCIKCYNLCPEEAVLIGGRSRDRGCYKRYKGPSRDLKPIKYR
jgi:NAD-dependent dihydropyrimidine dehydrogenase PreA subunit/flavodoxin